MEALDPAQPEIRLAALLHNLEKGLPASVQKIPIEGLAKAASTAVYAKKILKRFMYPGKMVDNILHCIAHHRDFRSWDSEDIPSFLPKIRQLQYLCVTEERFDNLLNFISLHDNSKDTDKILQEIHLASTEMQEEGTSMFSYELPYNSKEVMNMLGPEHSIYTGKCIHYLQQLACENPVRTCNEWRKLMKAFIKDIKEKSNTLTTKKKKRKKRRYYQHNMKKKQI